MPSRTHTRKVRYAVAGLGYISQSAVLPAFANASENSELTALISGDGQKLAGLGKNYGVTKTYPYEAFDDCMRSGEVDAVYIALPNALHREYAERAARAHVHVLCEKPMAVTEEDCEAMIEAARKNRVKLMIAYRLHFDRANLSSIEAVQSGSIGEPRIFTSVFTQQVVEGNIRLDSNERGGGTLYDIGIYCINAARYLFRDEPVEVYATTANNGEPRFRRSEEMASAILRFPAGRQAAFTCSFGAASVSTYRVVGTKGSLRLEPAYDYDSDVRQWVVADGRAEVVTFPRHDQFAPQLIYFSNCILDDREPEPSGLEGLADVRVIRALYHSATIENPVQLGFLAPKPRPGLSQELSRPAVRQPDTIHAAGPSGKK